MIILPTEEIRWIGHLNVVSVRIFAKATFIACLSSFLHVVNCTALMHEATRKIAAMNWRLHCLTSWTHHASKWYQGCNVGDFASDIKLMMVSDAFLEGDLKYKISTSGGHSFYKWARNTFVRVTWVCKKQGAVLHWTVKAEVIALVTGMRLGVCPLSVLGHCGPLFDHTNPLKSLNSLAAEATWTSATTRCSYFR